MSKPVVHPASSCVRVQECGEDVSELRHKLSSVGWIQCDNIDCLKWRQVRLQILLQVTEDTPWTCNKNEDDNYNRCSIPEEDTSCYEKLAKRAKLDIITSRLKPGTLVWAKVQGYCRWPALITADPVSGEHTEEDDFEAVQYHVEFLGDRPSHGWVKTKSVEVFGPGNMELPTAGSQVQPGPAQKWKRLTSACRVNHKDGSHRVQQAIDEALKLLPLPLEARLKTCQFVTLSRVNRRSRADSRQQLPQMTSAHSLRKPLTALEQNNYRTAGTSSMGLKHAPRQPQVHTKNSSPRGNIAENTSPLTRRSVHSIVPRGLLPVASPSPGMCKLSGSGKCTLSEHAGGQMRKPNCMLFPLHLIDTSIEARFMEDVQVYQDNEQRFEQELALFHARCALTPADLPTWHNMQPHKYCIFLAVMGRGGFLRVSDQHQWSTVYTEITSLSCRQGAGLCRKYYQRNLYPFELYICGHGYSTLGKQRNRCVEHHSRASPDREAGDSGVDTDGVETCCTDDEFDSPDIVRHLDELDHILMSLDQAEDQHGHHTPGKASEVLPLTCVPLQKSHSVGTDSQPDVQMLPLTCVPVQKSHSVGIDSRPDIQVLPLTCVPVQKSRSVGTDSQPDIQVLPLTCVPAQKSHSVGTDSRPDIQVLPLTCVPVQKSRSVGTDSPPDIQVLPLTCVPIQKSHSVGTDLQPDIQVLPLTCVPVQNSHSVGTNSQPDIQVLPLTCVPVQNSHSVGTNSQPDIQVLHEMQGLQCDLDCLQDEVDLL